MLVGNMEDDSETENKMETTEGIGIGKRLRISSSIEKEALQRGDPPKGKGKGKGKTKD